MKTRPQSDGHPPLGFHNRLETHVAVAVTLVVAFALGAALFIATRVVTNGSLDRASRDLTAARSAFYLLEDDRAEFAAAQATLVTTLPLFRAYLTDSRVASDIATMQVMANDYRQQLKAAFCIVTGRDGVWTGSSGWLGGVAPPPSMSRMIFASAAGQPQRDVVEVDSRLFLVVSEPARFAEETLGTLTVGYALDDEVARQLAEVTHSDVSLVVGSRLAASSLTGDGRAALANAISTGQSFSPGGTASIKRLGSSEYVAGAFPLSPNGQVNASGQLVLLQDWAPTRRYLTQLQRQMVAAGAVIFGVALAGGLLFARRVSGPLKDIASAADDIAGGNWSRWVPVRGTAEAIVMARGFNDMTTSLRHWYEEAKRRDDELRQAQKMEAIGRLAGGIAHDFNNLLTAITGYSEILLHHLDQRDPRREDATQILAASVRAAELTRQLLTFSRRQAATPSILALDQIVAGTQPMLRRIIGEDIELITSIGPDLGRVRADRGQLEQVLLNLVVNARDAMPKGGTLRIGLANAAVGAAPHDVMHSAIPESYVCLSVADSGHGMDRETAARIFEPFFTTKETGQGTGLGLAIVYGIVQQAGGMIDLETEIGQGTTFRVYLPRVTDEEPAPVAAAEPEFRPAPVVQGTGTVLVAEDDDRLSTLIGNTLNGAGYTVLQASHGEEALDIARGHAAPIHLLLADVVMPGMSGRMLAERVRSIRPQIRVLYMSGHSDEAIMRQGVQIGGSHFIRKPFSMDTLARKIHETLKAPLTALVVALLLVSASAAFGQRIFVGGGGFLRYPPRWASPQDFDGSWNYCRGFYTSTRREAGGTGWSTDFPGADNNFSVRLAELTFVRVKLAADGQPANVVVRLTDPMLYRCPLLFMEDTGTVRFSEAEVQQLRTYFAKGGFLWVDDFWGTEAWSQWADQIGRVLPSNEYPIVDIPPDHEIMHTLYDVKAIPQVSSIQFWYRSGGNVSERGPDSPQVNFRGIRDHNGRLIVVMTHNTDISDTWEREGENREYFERFSPAGYAVGVNVVLYAMSH